MKIQEHEADILRQQPEPTPGEQTKNTIKAETTKKIIKDIGIGLLIAGLAPFALVAATCAASTRRGRRGNRRR